jgi:hypothetical protein
MNNIWNKEELPEQWNEFIIVPIYKKGDKTDRVIIEVYHHYQLHNIFIQYSSVKVNSIHSRNYWDHQCGLQHNQSTNDQIFCIHQILEKKW